MFIFYTYNEGIPIYLTVFNDVTQTYLGMSIYWTFKKANTSILGRLRIQL